MRICIEKTLIVYRFTYRALCKPSTFVLLPLITAIRSLPLNHFTEYNSPHDWMSIGHSSATVWPFNFDIVLSEMEKLGKTWMKIWFSNITQSSCHRMPCTSLIVSCFFLFFCDLWSVALKIIKFKPYSLFLTQHSVFFFFLVSTNKAQNDV